MKKLLFGLIATVFLSAPMFAQDPPPKEDNPPAFQLEFGRKSMKCGGFGICVFRVNLTVSDVVTLVSAIVNPAGLLTLKMSPTFYKNHIKSFSNGYLIIDEDYSIDLETTRKIGVSDGYTIKKG
jgi:hypothetical protein